jgi:hypothetical protein
MTTGAALAVLQPLRTLDAHQNVAPCGADISPTSEPVLATAGIASCLQCAASTWTGSRERSFSSTPAHTAHYLCVTTPPRPPPPQAASRQAGVPPTSRT